MNNVDINNVMISRTNQNYGFAMRGQRFGKNNNNWIGQGKFITKESNRCYTCRNLGHFAIDCPRNARSKPRTLSMNKSRSRTRKTNEQNQRRNNSRNRNQPRNRNNNQSRNQWTNYSNKDFEKTPDNINYRSRYINNVEFDDEIYTPGYIDNQNNYYNKYDDDYRDNAEYDDNYRDNAEYDDDYRDNIEYDDDYRDNAEYDDDYQDDYEDYDENPDYDASIYNDYDDY